MAPHTAEHRSQAMSDCIDDCMHCHAICLETINYCLGMGGQHAAPEHMSLLATCAEICKTSANTMLRGAIVTAPICSACAQVCRQCGKSCERMGEDAAMMRCAAACRRCSESCAAVANH